MDRHPTLREIFVEKLIEVAVRTGVLLAGALLFMLYMYVIHGKVPLFLR